jgi:methylated-DNA-[protein]-cysteine S-methyltransferase
VSAAYSTLPSPVGELLLTTADGALTGLWMPAEVHGPPPGMARDDAAHAQARRQLGEYFAGERREFELAIAPRGTPFQQLVWAELQRVPYGETITYAQLAARIGRSTAIRAAGAANGRNPISIIVPCHRVIGSNGSLTGYGGGLDAKRALLELERTPA